MSDRTKTHDESGGPDARARNVAPEHRWPAVIAILIALALYALLPSSVIVGVRYGVVAVCVALLIPLVIYNPHHFTRESKWSRRAELGLATLLLIANFIAFAQVVVLLLHKSQNGGTLLLASVQVWMTNVIVFALIYWGMDRGGPVSRVTVARKKLPAADFRFPQDEDHDAIDEVAAGSSARIDWVPNFLDFLYFSLSNSMAFSPTDAMPLSHRAKMLMGLESFAAFVLLALVIARAVSLIG
jgi:small-conductance mechanosensitive channel